MAKPTHREIVFEAKNIEADLDVFECQCGERQTSELTPCSKCHTPLCDICMPFGASVPCLDCDIDPAPDEDDS